MDPGSSQIRPDVREIIKKLKYMQWASREELILAFHGINTRLGDLLKSAKTAPLHKLELLGLTQAALQVLTKHMQLLEAAAQQPGPLSWAAEFADALHALCEFVNSWLSALGADPGLQSSMRDFMVSSGG
jgi:hypothetical protein